MNQFSFARDRMATAADAIVASRVLVALDVDPEDQLEALEDQQFLIYGQRLLDSIVSSSMLVSDTPSNDGLAPSADGLAVLGAARSAMLQLHNSTDQVPEYFLHLREALKSHIESKASKDDLSRLRDFFEKLSSVLAEESASFVYPKAR